MKTMIDSSDIEKIINFSHPKPESILGIHEIIIDNKITFHIRIFVPKARQIVLIDLADRTVRYKMKKIHEDGFFEIIISDRQKRFLYKLDIKNEEGDFWEAYDPYAFPSSFNEQDLELFAKGIQYKIYEKLGAKNISIEGVSGVVFSVWAPNAKLVSLIGDFNSWDYRRHIMRKVKKSGIWEVFVPKLMNFERYKFEIRSKNDKVFEKSDPFAYYCELRPSTASLIFDIDKYKWGDSEWIAKRENSDIKKSPVNIYQMHLSSWKLSDDAGRFLSFGELSQDLIPYIKKMNYSHIELMPIQEHSYDGSWGFQTTNYYAITSRFGTPNDFMNFVDLCHQNNIGIILDWVPSYFPKDKHSLREFDGSKLYEKEDKSKIEHPIWGTLLFDYSSNEVRNFLISNALFLLEKYHIDGLKIDKLESILYLNSDENVDNWKLDDISKKENIEAINFIKELNGEISSSFKNIIIASDTDNLDCLSKLSDENALGINLIWNKAFPKELLKYLSKNPEGRESNYYELINSAISNESSVFAFSNDFFINGRGSLINKMPGDIWHKFANLRLAFSLMYMLPAKKLSFMSNEFAQFDEWDDDSSLDWNLLDDEHHKSTQNFVQALNNFYLKEEALWKYDFHKDYFDLIDIDNNDGIISFKRKSDNDLDELIIVCNFTSKAYSNYKLAIENKTKIKEVFNSDKAMFFGTGLENKDINIKNSSVLLDIAALSCHVFKLNK